MRRTRRETLHVRTVDVAELQAKADELAKELRLLATTHGSPPRR